MRGVNHREQQRTDREERQRAHVAEESRHRAEDPQAVYDQLRHEVASYSVELTRKPHVLLLSKRDLLADGDALPEVEALTSMGTLAFSSVAGAGLEEVKEYLWKAVAEARAAEAEREELEEPVVFEERREDEPEWE